MNIISDLLCWCLFEQQRLYIFQKSLILFLANCPSSFFGICYLNQQIFLTNAASSMDFYCLYSQSCVAFYNSTDLRMMGLVVYFKRDRFLMTSCTGLLISNFMISSIKIVLRLVR